MHKRADKKADGLKNVSNRIHLFAAHVEHISLHTFSNSAMLHRLCASKFRNSEVEKQLIRRKKQVDVSCDTGGVIFEKSCLPADRRMTNLALIREASRRRGHLLPRKITKRMRWSGRSLGSAIGEVQRAMRRGLDRGYRLYEDYHKGFSLFPR